MSITAYVGRTSDLLALHGTFPDQGEQLVEHTLCPAGTGGFLCTGAQKLAQRVLLVLLTKKGSMRFDQEYGTVFMLLAESGAWRTVADVEQGFYGAKLDLMRQLRAVELTTDPTDERISDLALLGVTIGPGFVKLTIQMVTLAGTSYKFIGPIPVTTH